MSVSWFSVKFNRKIKILLIAALLISLFIVNQWLEIALADTLTLYPNANGSVGQWRWVGGSKNYTNWQTNDGDTTYAKTNKNGKIQVVNLDDHTSETGTINSVTVYAVAKLAANGDDQLSLVAYTYGTAYASPSQSITTSYATYSYTWNTNPNTGSAWTWTEIDNLQAGVKYVKGTTGKEIWVTQVYVVVDYTPPSAQTIVGDGTLDYSTKTVGPSYTNVAVNAFTLRTNSGSDTVTEVVVDGSGSTDLTDVATNGVKLYRDDGTNPGDWDAGDTLIATTSFSGTTATFSSLNINVTTTEEQYLITYDISSSPGNGDTLVGYVSSVTASNPVTNNDDTDATITIDAQPPGQATSFVADPGDGVVYLTWTNPGDADFAGIRILKRTDNQYPTGPDDPNATFVYEDTTTPIDTSYDDFSVTNGTTYWYAIFTVDTYGNWNDTVTEGVNADTATPNPYTTVNDGTPVPGNKTVGPSYTNQAVDAFTLETSSGSDTISEIVVDGSGSTDLTDVATNGVKLYRDDGSTSGEWDSGDTYIAQTSFDLGTQEATFTALSIEVTTTAVQYLITYDISSSPGHNDTLVGYVSKVTSTKPVVKYYDDTDATITIDAQPPGQATSFVADPGDGVVYLTWTNPGDADFAGIRILKRTDNQYPTGPDDPNATFVYEDTTTPIDTSYDDFSVTNGTTYWYAIFTVDTYGNWNDTVTEGVNADTATPQALTVTLSNNQSLAAGDNVYHGQANKAMQRFDLATNTGSTTWQKIKIKEYGTGTATNNIGEVKLYRDDGDGIFEPAADTQLTLSPTTFDAEETTFTISGGETLDTTTKTYFIVYSFTETTSSETGVTVGSQLVDESYIIISSGTVAPFSNANSGEANLNGDIVTTSGVGTAPSSVSPGQTGVQMLELSFQTNYGTAKLTGIKLYEYGSGTATTNIQAVKIYRDDGDGTFDPGDTLLSTTPSTFTDETTNFTFSEETITTTAQEFYIIYDISASAEAGAYIGAEVTNESFITISAPDTKASFSAIQSGLSQVTAVGQVTVKSEFMRRGSVTPGQDGIPMQQLEMSTNAGTANWTAIKINEYGTGTATTNVAKVEIWKESNGLAGLQMIGGTPDSTLTISPTTFSAEETTFTLSSAEAISTSPSTFYIVYSLTSGAETDTTIGSKLNDETYITVDTSVKSFTNYMSKELTIVASPHGSSSNPISSNTNLCQACHAIHLAPDFSAEYGSGYTTRRILIKPYFEDTAKVNETTGTASTSHEKYNALCESCHDGTGSTKNIKSDYNDQSATAPGHMTKNASTYNAPTGWKSPPSPDSYVAEVKVPCMVCHDTHVSTKDNWKMLADGLYDYAIGQGWQESTADNKISSDDEKCLVCHRKSNETVRTESIVMGIELTLPSSHDGNTNCLSCHSNVHALSVGESSGGVACGNCHSFYNQMNSSTTTYHHYLTSDEATYTVNLDPLARQTTCLMCHVDHNIFSPTHNPTYGERAKNLRTDYTVTPSPNDTSTFTNYDFLASGTGGVCVSCHSVSRDKNTTYRKDDGSTKTPVITVDTYTASSHNYVANAQSTFTSDPSPPFYANCVKCHNDTTSKSYQNSSFKFATHYSDYRHILTDNGTASGGSGSPTASPTETTYNSLEENFCYLCHSGGAAGNDIYGQSMSASAKSIENVFNSTGSTHPVENSTFAGRHKADEYYSATQGWLPATNRHVECEDCHNPHAAQSGSHSSDVYSGSGIDGIEVGGVDKGVWGLDYTGANAFKSYNTGSVSVNNGSTTVSGSGTGWSSSNVSPGWYIIFLESDANNDLENDWYLITAVDYGTQTLTITPAFRGSNYSGSYRATGISPTKVASSTYQYSICLKCHSKFAWGNTDNRPNTPSGDPSGGTWKESDIAVDFDPNVNYSYHPLFKQGRNQPPAGQNPKWTDANKPNPDVRRKWLSGDPETATAEGALQTLSNTFTDGWYATSLVTCTDCHDNSDNSGPKGPHGSAYKWLFKSADPNAKVTAMDGNVYYTNNRSTDKGAAATTPGATRPKNFCTNCHRGDVYGVSDDNASDPAVEAYTVAENLSRFDHASAIGEDKCANPYSTLAGKNGNKWGIGCMNCHGGNEPGGIHGSARGKTGSGASPSGKHFVNGAAWNGHTLNEGVGKGTCFTKTPAQTPDNVNTCSAHGGGKDYASNTNYAYTMPEP
jgi:hypothetical protein